MAGVRRVIVGVHGSLGSLQALRYAADEARERCVPLIPVIAWVPPGGDAAERSRPSPYLRRIWRDEARKRLLNAFDAGLGGIPADVRVEPLVERGETGQVLVEVAGQPGDLLVIGTGRRGFLARALHKSVGRYCLAHARCPVLAVPPSALMDEMTRRPWRLRRHAHSIESELPALLSPRGASPPFDPPTPAPVPAVPSGRAARGPSRLRLPGPRGLAGPAPVLARFRSLRRAGAPARSLCSSPHAGRMGCVKNALGPAWGA